MTKTQWTTLVLFGAYLLWEFVLLAGWKSTTAGPPIRVDLILIIPILVALGSASIWQFFRSEQLG